MKEKYISTMTTTELKAEIVYYESLYLLTNEERERLNTLYQEFNARGGVNE